MVADLLHPCIQSRFFVGVPPTTSSNCSRIELPSEFSSISNIGFSPSPLPSHWPASDFSISNASAPLPPALVCNANAEQCYCDQTCKNAPASLHGHASLTLFFDGLFQSKLPVAQNLLRVGIVLHQAENVSFGVFAISEVAHSGNGRFR